MGSDEGLTLETSAPTSLLSNVGITYFINSFDYPNLLHLCSNTADRCENLIFVGAHGSLRQSITFTKFACP